MNSSHKYRTLSIQFMILEKLNKKPKEKKKKNKEKRRSESEGNMKERLEKRK